MTEIIEALDNWTSSQYPTLPQKLFGYCELVHKTEKGSDQPMPVTINGTSDRQFACLDDRYQLITWFRLPGTIELQNEVDGNDWAFGFDDGETQRAGLRWVIAHRVELGESWINNFLKAIPKGFNITGYQIVHIDKNGLTLDADHESIYNTELGKTVYEKHRFTWNLYVINLTTEYILCPTAVFADCCTDSFITEDGECLTPE